MGFEYQSQGPNGNVYKSSQYPDVEITYKPEPANPSSTGPMSQHPRVQIKVRGQVPSMYNPFTGKFHGPRSAEAHILVDNECR